MANITIKDILEADINNMTNDEMKKMLKTASRYTSRRTSYIKENFETTPATVGLYKSLENKLERTNIPSSAEIDAMTQSELRKLWTIEKNFLEAKTSKKAGVVDWSKNMIATVYSLNRKKDAKQINAIYNKYKKNISKIWELVDKIREASPALEFMLGSNEFIEQVMVLAEKLEDPISIYERIKTYYEEEVKEKTRKRQFRF